MNYKDNGYKNDGFDLSDLQEQETSTHYFMIVDLSDFSVIGMFSNEELLELEVAKLENSNDRMTATLAFPKTAIDTPIEAL